ncbi:MAG: putative toxin-antitoxin system toxin component, PIN family [Terracidiphilus sp.]
MLVVLDSNVFLSAILSPAGIPAKLHEAWRQKRFELATCTEQIDEIRRASRYPRFRAALQPYRFGILINNLSRARVWSQPLPNLFTANDPGDSFLLNLAKAIEADYLVTSDKRSHILKIKKVGGTRILTPRRLCDDVLHL